VIGGENLGESERGALSNSTPGGGQKSFGKSSGFKNEIGRLKKITRNAKNIEITTQEGK